MNADPLARLITTLGPRSANELGAILPHEHVFVDLRTWDQPGYAEADPAAVIELMAPEIERARAAGVTAIVECSTVGVGRRADISPGRTPTSSNSFCPDSGRPAWTPQQFAS